MYNNIIFILFIGRSSASSKRRVINRNSFGTTWRVSFYVDSVPDVDPSLQL